MANVNKVYRKLVRDKIPEIIKADGGNPVTRILDDKEYLIALVEKLKEELAEFATEFSAEELADIQEVVYALGGAIGKTHEELEAIRLKKAATNGTFKDKIYLESVESD
jgi:predicted house-cleaning noncanonical NTP pyrophosphatase (MazG superfamily)